MTAALKDKPATPFRVPAGIKLIRVDPRTGMRAGGEGGILEAFKPGTAPPDSYSVIGAAATACAFSVSRRRARRGLGYRRAVLSRFPPARERRPGRRRVPAETFRIFGRGELCMRRDVMTAYVVLSAPGPGRREQG